MKETTKLVEKLMNAMDRGLMYINREKRILIYNQKAREITGIDFDHTNTHEAGELLPGDLVILADNDLGDDDGELTTEDLQLLNIHDPDMKAGDMVMGVGVYKNKKIEPVYKYVRGHQLRTPFVLDTNYLGFHIMVIIDGMEKRMSIHVNGHVFPMNFFNSIGHGVVMDGTNGHIKFFQMPGYSVRKEALATLLRGGRFLAKNKSNETGFPIIGEKLLDMVEENELTKKIFELLDGKEDHVKEAIYEINRRPCICSLIPFFERDEESGDGGVFVVLQDATQMGALLEDRNRIIEEIEKKEYGRKGSYQGFPSDSFEGFVGNGPLMQEVKYLAYKASKTKFNVLITGESGTGKSQLAREIHDLQHKNQSGEPFVEVHCNAIAPTLFESELFGYVGGAFTGAATGGKAGYFESANKGTILFDEIGEIPPEIQVKLLQVLQNKIIYRVGSSTPIQVDVRVIAATNRDLEREVEQGTFRRDLFYRMNVFPIDIPPLRERKTDLYLLMNQILRKACARYDVPLKQFSGEAFRKMYSYGWPGNVRELENIIERAITLCESGLIYPEHIRIANEKKAKTMKALLQEEENRLLQDALVRFNGDKQKVMKELDISKSVFYEKCKRYGIGSDSCG